MENGRHVFIRSFWDAYDNAGVLFVIALFWILTGFPWLVAAAFLYMLFPGLGTGILVMLPLLKLNPATRAAYRYFHAISYHDSIPPFKEYFRYWRQGAVKTQLLLAAYLTVAAVLHVQWQLLGHNGGPASRTVGILLLVQLLLYLFCLTVLPLSGPMEMFRPRPVRELAWQSVLIFFNHTLLSASVFAVNVFLGFSTVRFGVMALIFVPITVVLDMNLLYYVYMKHGSLPRQPLERRSFRELLKPFSGKISDE